jgi:hypothetical protein
MAGYTRQSTYTDGDIIQAADSNDEFDQLLAAFNNSTGHAHDGTAAEGPVIGLIGDPGVTTPLNKVVVSDTNNRIGVFVDVSSSSVEQFRFQDGVIVPVTNNDIDLGTSSLKFKNGYFAGNLTVDGNITLGGDITLGDSNTDSITLGAEVASHVIPDVDNTYDLGSSTKEWRNLYIDGTANIDSLVADTADINAGTIDNTVIGGTTAVAGTFTALTATGTSTLTTVDINGGAIDGTIIGATTAAAITGTTITANTSLALASGATVTAILDEDAMTSNSATALATQQSIKAYVDAQVTAQDLDFQADTGGALSIDLDSETMTFTGGTGIDTSGSGNTVTFAIDSTVATLTGTQTLTNKTLTTPIISSISNTGTLTLPTSTDTLVGRATTDTLTNKTLTSAVLNGTISGTSIKDEDDMVSNSASHLATQQSIKAYVDAQVTAQDLDFQGDSGGALSIDLDSETLTIAGGTGIDTSGSLNTLTVAIDSTVATLTGTQTLTNKTLTSPTINGGTLSSTVTGTTQASGTSNTTIATTAFAATEAANQAVAMAIALG